MGTQLLTGAQNINFSKTKWLLQKKSPRESSTQEPTGKMTLSTGLVKENLTGWQLLDKFILSGREQLTENLKRRSKDKSKKKLKVKLSHLQPLPENDRLHWGRLF